MQTQVKPSLVVLAFGTRDAVVIGICHLSRYVMCFSPVSRVQTYRDSNSLLCKSPVVKRCDRWKEVFTVFSGSKIFVRICRYKMCCSFVPMWASSQLLSPFAKYCSTSSAKTKDNTRIERLLSKSSSPKNALGFSLGFAAVGASGCRVELEG